MTQPRWRASYIASCPQCCGDLDDEGSNWWCSACDRSWSFQEIALLDESDLDND